MDAISSGYKRGIKCKSYADMEMAGQSFGGLVQQKRPICHPTQSHLGLMLEPLRDRYEPMISAS